MTVEWVDVFWAKCKNFQYFSSLEIYYDLTGDNFFIVQIKYHISEVEYVKEVISAITWGLEADEVKFESLISVHSNIDEYDSNVGHIYIKSKNYNLYRSMNLIFFLKDGDWNNMDEMIKLNTWN